VTLLRELKADTPAVVAALAARLQEKTRAYEGVVELRQQVIRTLGKLGPRAEPAVPALAEALDTPELLEDAARALRDFVSPNATAVGLVRVLSTIHDLDDRQIALVLGVADTETVPVLARYLESPRARVRAAAALSLYRIASRKIPLPEITEAQPALIGALAARNRQVRLNAIQAVAQPALHPKEARKQHAAIRAALEKELAHWDEATRVEAALRLAQVALREPFANAERLKTHLPAGVLVEALKKEGDPLRQQAFTEALKELAGIRTDLHLVREMSDVDPVVRERIARALGEIAWAQDTESAVLALGKAVADRHATLRGQAAQSLGRLAQAEGADLTEPLKKEAPALETALRDRDHSVRQAAAIALWRITRQADKAAPVLLEALPSLAFEDPEMGAKLRAGKLPVPALVALREMAGRAQEALAAALKHDNERVRAGVVVVMDSVDRPAPEVFAPQLTEALQDRSATVRLQAAVALRWLELNERQRERVIELLDRALDDGDARVRLQAVVTLGVSGRRLHQVRVERLSELLRDRDAGVRARAVEAVGRVGRPAAPAVPALRRALKDASADVRRQAAAALGKVGPASLPALKEALSDKDHDIRKHAALALGGMGAEARDALPALRTALKDSDDEVAAAVADAVKKVEAGAIREP
jgi:HEAT repeat protein